MRRIIRGVRLKHLNASGRFPSGNVRYYYRPKGQKGIPLPDLPPDHPKFIAEYAALHGAKPERPKPRTGTIAAGCRAYIASDVYLALAASTRAYTRRAVEDIEARYGLAPLDDLRPRHIRQDLAPMGPHPANNRLKVWRALGRWWLDAGLIEADPARDVRRRATPVTDGHTAWTRDDVAQFRAYWPHDTPQRLAFELMHRTCASIGDACKLGPGMVKDGWLTYRRGKSGSEAACPFSAPARDWFEADGHLARCLALAPRHALFMVTKQGRARSTKSAAQWFSRACTSAGLQHLSAHGIRKHRASVFKENGATTDQRMAVLGHETQSEARKYSKSADLRRIISGTESSNSGTSSNSGQEIVLKHKGMQ